MYCIVYCLSIGLQIIEMEAEPPLLHGEAVNIDGFFCVILSHRRRLISTEERDRIFYTMKALGLPTIDALCVPQVLWRGLEDALEHRNGKQRLPLLNGIGSCIFVNDVSYEELEECVYELNKLHNLN